MDIINYLKGNGVEKNLKGIQRLIYKTLALPLLNNNNACNPL